MRTPAAAPVPRRRSTRVPAGICVSLLLRLLPAAAALPPARLPAQDWAAFSTAAQQGALAVDRKVERRLDASASHLWTLELKAGEYVYLELLQKEAAVVLQVLAPGGRVRQELDGAREAQRIEQAQWIADTSGRWSVALKTAGGAAGPGGAYEIRWAVRRQATAHDRQLVAADSARRLGAELHERGSYAAADTAHRRALELRQRLLGADHADVATSLRDVAVIQFRLGRFGPADSLARRALAIHEAALGAEHPQTAATWNVLGVIHFLTRRYAVADSLYRRALAIQEKSLGADHLQVAWTLNNIAQLHSAQRRYAAADTVFRRVLAIQERVLGGEHRALLSTLVALAYVGQYRGRYADAEQAFRRAIAIRAALFGDDAQVGNGTTALGWVVYQQGRYAEAESLYHRALAIQRKALGPEHLQVSWSMHNLAVLYVEQGRYADAEPLHRRALAIKEKELGAESPEVASSLSDLGVLYFLQFRFEEAEPLYRRALAIREKAFGPEHEAVAGVLENLGLLYIQQVRFAEAEPLFHRALAVQEKLLGAEHPKVANVLNNIGYLYQQQGRFAEAEPLMRRALALQEKALGPEHVRVSVTLTNLAVLAQRQGRFAEAEPLHQRALAIREATLGSRAAAQSLSMLGSLYFRQGKYAEAERLYRRDLAATEEAYGADATTTAGARRALARAIMLRGGDIGEARRLVERAIATLDAGSALPDLRVISYALRAELRQRDGDRAGAAADMAEAIRGAEELRPRVGGGEETRAAFFSEYAYLFDLMVAWRLEAGDVAGALEYAERGRARVLLDQLAAGKVDLRQSIPADVRAPLEARERNAQARMAELQQRLTLLRSRKDLAEPARGARRTVLEDSLRAAEHDFREVYEEIRNASPLWRDLLTSGGQPVSLATIQRRVVPERGLLLLYQNGTAGSYVFVVPPNGAPPEAVPLTVGRAEAAALGVEPGALTAAVLERVLGGVSSQTMKGEGLAALLSRAPGRPGRARTPDASMGMLHALWRVLVPAPVWQRVRAAEQVVVIPDRGLYQLPFEALVVQPGPSFEKARYWLDDGPPVRYAASATTLHNLEQRAAARLVPALDSASVLSLSDPVFDPAQLSLPRPAEIRPATPGASGGATSAAAVTRNSYERFGGSLAALPGTAAETEAVRKAFAPDAAAAAAGGAVVVLQRLEATEARLRPALGGKRFLHLATHGLVDERGGSLFAALALTPPGSEKAAADDDGFLQLHEIYSLRLPELELAVLSACETNAGATVDGEGVFALSRGFLAAGARRVIASEWVVDDRSTADLMGHFFRGVASAERAGRRTDYVGALREAKREVRRQPRWAHPYFWAPFVLTGAK